MDETKELSNAISSRFEIAPAENYTLDDLKRALFTKILELLDGNLERLLSMLYRVDLSQKKLDEIFLQGTKDEIAMQIAEAVIERQLQKIRTRKFYKNHESGLIK